MTSTTSARWVDHPFDMAPIGLILLDDALRVLDANTHAWGTAGVDPSTACVDPGALLRELAFPSAAEVLMAACAQALDGRGPRRFPGWAWPRPDQQRFFDDATGRIDRYNRRWHEYTCPAHGGSAPECWLETVHLDDAVDAELAWCRALVRGAAATWWCRIRRGADGAWRWHQLRAWPSWGPLGTTSRWLAVCTDIHDLRAGLDDARRTAMP